MRSNLRAFFFVFPLLLLCNARTSTIPAYAGTYGPRIEFAYSIHDFGVIGQNMIVSHEFPFHNIGDATLSIASVESPCSCAAVLLSSDTIAPGAAGILEVAFSSGMRLGTVRNAISVHSNDSTLPERIIEIVAEVKPMFTAKPDPLVFDVGGDEREKMLRVTRLDDAAPRIIAAAASAEFLGATIEVMDDIAPILFENEMDTFVRVRLNDTGIETPQRESILLSLDYPPEAVLNLPVVIRKEQHVSVIPPIVAFGVVKRGSAATKLLRVIGDASVDVGQLKVRGSPNVIRAAFETSNAPGEAAWKIEIGADAPPGFLNGEIVITTGEDGPVLAEVPVFALIED